MHSKKALSKSNSTALIPVDLVEQRIFFIRGHKVMLDSDLAALYQVRTKELNKAVKRNSARFPNDFMFQLSRLEAVALRFQIGTSNKGRGGRRYLPLVFTEQGVAMLSSILKSERAITVNIAIMRAFVRLRSILAAHKELARKIDALERKTASNFEEVYRLITKYLKPTALPKPRIGFRTATNK